MSCSLIALDKLPGMRPVGIWEMLHHAIAKLVMRAAGDQAKTAFGSLKLCVGLEAVIEGADHSVVQRRQGRHAPDPEEGAEEASEGAEYKRTSAPGGTESAGGGKRQ